MKRETRQKLASEKAKIERRLDAGRDGSGERPSLTAPNIEYEVADKTSATTFVALTTRCLSSSVKRVMTLASA